MAQKKRRHERIAMNELALELFNHYNFRNQDTITKLVKTTLEKIRRRIVQASHVPADYGHPERAKKPEKPCFKCHALLAIPTITLSPNLDDVQSQLSRASQAIANIASKILQWTKNQKLIEKKNSFYSHRRPTLFNGEESSDSNPVKPGESNASGKSYLKAVLENKEISKLLSLIATSIASIKTEVSTGIMVFDKYNFIWEKKRETALAEFLENDPQVSEFEGKLKELISLSNEINSYPEFIEIGAIAVETELLKSGIISEIKLWKVFFGKQCNTKYRLMIEEVLTFIEDCYKKLQRPINDLDDIREAMQALREFRENEIRIDLCIVPIEESYAMLQKHEIDLPREEIDRCDTLRYNWEKLKQLATQKSHTLLEIQSKYKDDLKKDVKEFVVSCDRFGQDYRENGPGVPGIEPRDASDRLFMFQNQFETLFRKYTTYTGGEELFGLPVTEYTELLQIK